MLRNISYFEKRRGEVLDNWIGLKFMNHVGISLGEWKAAPFFDPRYKTLGLVACPLYEAMFIFGFDKTMDTNIIARIKPGELMESYVVVTIEDYDGVDLVDGYPRVIQEKHFIYALGNMNEDYANMIQENVVLQFPSLSGSIRHGGYHVEGYRYHDWGLKQYPTDTSFSWASWVSGTIVSQNENHITIINDETNKSETYLVNWSSIDHDSKTDLTEKSDYTSFLGLNIRPIFFPNF